MNESVGRSTRKGKCAEGARSSRVVVKNDALTTAGARSVTKVDIGGGRHDRNTLNCMAGDRCRSKRNIAGYAGQGHSLPRAGRRSHAGKGS